MDEYHKRTCIRFEPYNGNEPNYIRIVKGSGCSSRVGMTGGQQEVSIGDGCGSVGIVEHELMHVLGFVHEQSRTDRDDHVKVNYQNIRRGMIAINMASQVKFLLLRFGKQLQKVFVRRG